MPTPVRQDQFEISPKGITHKPTGASFTPYPGEPSSGTMNLGQLGSVLPNGDDYRPHEVQAMMRQLWAVRRQESEPFQDGRLESQPPHKPSRAAFARAH
jgi:hypothetical protein